ncbi:aminoglycoside 6'-acetyltransferase, partial [Kouleothrix aurantiaca]
MRIADLRATDTALIEQIAALLVAAFAEHWPDAWPTLEEARAEVHESFAAERISRVAMDDDGAVMGWIGGISGYGGLVWELHPLAVQPHLHGRGVGRAHA